MNLYDLFMYACIILLFLVGFFNIYAAWYFRKHKSCYDAFLVEYKRGGFQLDLSTNVASYLGGYANYQKIVFFVNLKEGREMKFSQSELVHKEAYDFVKMQPDAVTKWMVKLLKIYRVTYLITIAWAMMTAFFIYKFN
ncbi:hypothetical protein F3J38_13810 [Pantoea sp. Acro-805]|jgi:hypothetical protein|uniref:DUF3592 domain-containing protein n=1 Tax=Candidatus Pantoea formicae TaxID=2608355 RepID=A0ABX0QVS0_9GAMM|nr:hypothetical protein [Pantoea formicae]MDF7647086.1 hypothetical protein [Erwiniaceae bacterium L1_54_3]NIF01127.1 hypothetical protein [Pantoea formicae]